MNTADLLTITSDDLAITRLGERTVDTPLADLLGERQETWHYVTENDRVLLDVVQGIANKRDVDVAGLPAFNPGGPRRKLFFEPSEVTAAIVIGGDGTLRGAQKLADEAVARGERIAVVGIPKTIDNDIPWIDRSFGFHTAFAQAAQSIRAAHIEASSTENGVGLVKLMGRHSG